MPLYVHEVEARVVPGESGEAGGEHGLSPEQFRALVEAVAAELARRGRREEALRRETAITGRNRPPSVAE